MRAAAVQLNSTVDVATNVEAAERLVRAAAADGAKLVALPEKWNLLGPGEALVEGAEPLEGPSLTAARSWAAELEIHLLAGSVAERLEGSEKVANTSVLIGPHGRDVAVYRKLHLFDVEVGGVTYRESEYEQAGGEIVMAQLARPAEGDQVPSGDPPVLGMSVCYDLRFPELYRILAVRGARVLAVPSAFTEPTGRAHWEVLLRARAIENQAFVLAPNQVGEAPPHYRSYGHSAIVDPWGRTVALAPEGPCWIAAELDFAAQERIRAELPSLANRRPDVYLWPEPVEAA